MAEDEHKDMLFYVIAGVVAFVLLGLLWRWIIGGYYDAALEATPLR